MTPSNKLLSDLVSFRTYSKYIPHLQRREVLEETINRSMTMHLDKFPKLSKQIIKAFKKVHDLELMPSMRALQFSGEPIVKNNTRIYNCSYTLPTTPRKFGEILFLLLSGTGVGYSVQKHHIKQLPRLKAPTQEGRFVIQDSIQGWAQSVQVLMEAYFNGAIRPIFDFADISPKGTLLRTTGAKAPGPEPLKYMLGEVEKRLKQAIGRQLESIEIHDIICIISDCVLAGGIRRSSLISFFDRDDSKMLKCKSGNWWEKHPYRARANNSAVLPRGEVTKSEFMALYAACKDSNAGEPGFFWTNDPYRDLGGNPCFSYETLIHTQNGPEQIGSLVGKKGLKIKDMNGNLVNAVVWSNGIKNVITVKLSNGESITCTPEHRFLTSSGEESMAKDLSRKRIMPLIEFNKTNDEFVKLGFIQGDGCTGRLNSNTHIGLEINIGSKDLDIAELFKIPYEEGKRAYYVNGYNEILKDLGFDPASLVTRTFPKTFDNWTDNQKKSFLRGMFSANGSVISGHRIAFKAVSFDLISKLSEVLTNFGYDSYITTNKSKPVKFANGTYVCRESYDLNISSYLSVIKFAKEIGFVHLYKTESLIDLIKVKSPMALSIKDSGEREVFDFNLNGDCHWGVIGSGLIAHNCLEISLNPDQFCNLTIVNQTGITSKEDFMARIYSASLLGTLQASYTDFPYLSDSWRKQTEAEALLGISFTGIADSNGLVTAEWLREGAKLALEVNAEFAKKIGINPAARVTAVKPEGTSSLVLGSSSGIHSRKSKYYLRRVQINKDDATYLYLLSTVPNLVDDAIGVPNTAVITVPQESPDNCPTEDKETAMQLFNRVMMYQRNWIAPGHRSGLNKNNVSVTISPREDEWNELAEAMWEKRDLYTGISLFPYDNGTYQQAPFESCDKETFEKYYAQIKELDMTQVKEFENNVKFSELVSCAGGACELVQI
jgi:hypothetical protein